MNRTTYYALAKPSSGFLSGFDTEVISEVASSIFNLLITIAFIVVHAIGEGTVILLFILQILPNKQRVKAQSFGAGINWRIAAAITLFGTSMINHLGPWKIFSDFLFLMILQHLLMLSTTSGAKSRSLECVQKEFITT